MEEYRQYLSYDENTGVFTWIKKSSKFSNVSVGDIAGATMPKGYIMLRLKNAQIYAHRLAWWWVYGEEPTGFIDHINGNPSDNSIANLRVVSRSGNAHNQTIHRQGRLPGAIPRGDGKFQAVARRGNKNHHLGTFDTAIEAHQKFMEFINWKDKA